MAGFSETDSNDSSDGNHEEDSGGNNKENENKITCLRIVVTRFTHKLTKRYRSPPPFLGTKGRKKINNRHIEFSKNIILK